MTRRHHAGWLAAVFVLLVAPSILSAHAVVYPKSALTGAYERYVLRVPNEKEVPTVRVEIRFPATVRVTSFGEVPGWQLEVLSDSAKRIIGAVWTGSLGAHRFVELPFIGVNPKVGGELVWQTVQTYADGQRVEWVGPRDSKAPASVTVVGAPPSSTFAASSVAWAALVVAVVALGVGLRRQV